MTAFSVRTVRELKGAPLACFILIAMAGQPVNNDWLCRFSGYSDKPVSQALKLLSSPELQLVRRVRGGWVLASVEQLVLSASDSLCLPKSRKNSDSTTTILINQDNNEPIVVAGRKNSDSTYKACLEACKKGGIFEPSASQISDLEHVTPELITAHIADLGPGETRGLAILRIRNNELPASWTQPEHQNNSYLTGAFDEYLNV